MKDFNHFYTLSLPRDAEIPCEKNRIEIVEEDRYGKYVICRR